MPTALSVLLVCLLSTTAVASAPTAKDARRLLRYPGGSLSLGYTNTGTLLRGVPCLNRDVAIGFLPVS